MSDKDRIIDLLLRLPLATKQQIIARLDRHPLAQPVDGTMEAQFKSTLAAILKLDAEQIDLTRCALDYGMDSISFMQWLNLWQKHYGTDLRGIEAQLHEPLSSWLDSIVALPLSVYGVPQAGDQWHDMHWRAQGSANASDEPTMQLLSRLLAERVALRVHDGQLHLRYTQALPNSVEQLLAGNEQRLSTDLGQGEWYPAFPIQRRYWLLTEMSGEQALYTNIIGLALHGKLDQDLLRDLCLQLLQSEKALRVVLHRVGQQIVQQVCKPEQVFDFQTIDLQHEGDTQQADRRLRQILLKDASIDKQHGPCVKFRLFRLAPQLSHFYLLIDHIVSDAFSLIQLMQILLDSLQHGKLQLPASWRSRSYLDKALLPPPVIAESTRQFWRKYLQDAPYNTNLPLTAAAAEQDLPQYSGATARIDLAGLPQLSAFAAEHKITLFKLISALLLRLLQDWTGESELVVGFPVQRKTDPADLEMIGDYTNTLPLRVRLPQRGEWSLLLSELSANLDQLMPHADLPFEQIASLQPRRMEFENPLFNVMFNEQPSYAGLNRQADQLQANLLDDPNLTARAKMALMFIWSQNGDRLSLFCEYRSKLFSAAGIEQLLGGLPSLIEQCLHHVRPPKLCIAASFSIEPLEKELREWFTFFDWRHDIACADFNQVFQELVKPNSLLANNRDGVNLILVRAEDVAANRDEWLQLLQNFLQAHRTPLILMLSADSEAWRVQHGDMHDWHALLRESLAGFAHATVIDSAHIARSYPVAVRDDPHRYRLGQIPYTDSYYRVLAASATRAMFALRYKKPKVIVLDCDNTLWQGVIGEDGMDGIRITPVLLQLQRRMLELQQAGILLCLCSKNVEADVMQVLRQHPGMLLRPEHLVGWKINWQAKSENIAQLARELNLGEDSLVFIDDNPVEISEVRAACPAVACLLLPREESAIARFVDHHWLLDVPRKSTDEDVNRTRMYQQNRERSQLLQSADGFIEFLDKLQLDIRIEPMTEAQLERMAQLMTRTNQFNTTTRRRSAAEIQAYQSAAGQVCTVTVKDRFGDYGLVGVLLYRLYGDVCEVDDLLMSCRVLGRGVEHRIIAYAAQQALQHGKSRLVIAYRQTAKNQPVRLFIEQELLPEQNSAAEDGCERLLFSAARLAELYYAPTQTPIVEHDSAPRALRSEYNTALLARLQTLQQAGPEFYRQALLPERTHTLLQQRLGQWLHKLPGNAPMLRFSETDMEQFAAASHDYNPLHRQPAYAAATAFGRPVVFGILGVLRSLQAHADFFAGQAAWTLRIQFHHALLQDMGYQLHSSAQTTEHRLVLEIRDGDKVMTGIEVQARPQPLSGSLVLPSDYRLREQAADPEPSEFAQALHGCWSDNSRQEQAANPILRRISRVLMACSYLIGMERPGRQALFSALRLDIDTDTSDDDAPLAFQLRPGEYNADFGLLQYQAVFAQRGKICAQAELKAFRRSLLPAWQASLPPAGAALQGKRAFISGATRGLGAALALQLARAGCQVWINYRHSNEAAQQLRDLLPEQIHLLADDINRDWPRIWQQLQAETQGSGVDFMILNAAPAALELYPGDLNREQIATYVEQCLGCMQQAAACFVAEGQGKLVYISSLFAERDCAAETTFFPYVLAKQMAEHYLHNLAQSSEQADILIVRPDRIATDMANKTNFSLANTLQAEAVAAAILPLLRSSVGIQTETVTHHSLQQEKPAAPAQKLADEMQSRLRQIWCNALEHDDADPEHDFFAQGGSSMNLVELIADIRKQFGIALDYVDLPREITLTSLSRLLGNKAMDTIDTGTNYGFSSSLSSEGEELLKSAMHERLQNNNPEPAAQRGSEDRQQPWSGREDIAIVGIDARFPGSDNLQQFWRNILDDCCMIEELPAQRRIDFIRSLPLTDGRRYFGSFLQDIDLFDAEFFQVTAGDAQAMPPHLRLLLQCAWNCIQEAGFAPGQAEVAHTGVFVAGNVDAYSKMLDDSLDGNLSAMQFTTRLQGMTPNFIASSISHYLHMSGPSEVVSTTCSSFLVALHRAVTSLQAGDCQQALVGAANLIIDPLSFLALEKIGILSENGHVRSFQPEADGTTLGEGIGAVLLMPLSRARQLGAHVHAVIAATASGHGGRGASPVAPNSTTQVALWRRVCQLARCTPQELDYLELHGMGHAFADNAELRALTETFSSAKTRVPPILLSTLKPNLAHLMEASGLASLLKVIAALQHETLPAMSGAQDTPEELRNCGLQFADRPQHWEQQGRARQAAVNSFGLTAVYACAVLREAPQVSAAQSEQDFPDGLAVPLSAHHDSCLHSVVQRLSDWLQCAPEAETGLTGLALTLQRGRSHLACRTVFIIRSRSELRKLLADSLKQETLSGRAFGNYAPDPALRAWLDGANCAWPELYPDALFGKTDRISLPAYPFAGQRYWIDSKRLRQQRVLSQFMQCEIELAQASAQLLDLIETPGTSH